MVIINPIINENNRHDFEFRSWEKECWIEGWLEVPAEFESLVLESEGHGNIELEEGVIVGYTPTDTPTEPEEPDTPEDTVTWGEMANAISEGVNEV